MESITLIIALIAVILVFLLPIRWGFLVYLAILLYYPSYLRIIAGGLTISAGRIVVVALLVRCLFNDHARNNFRWSLLDTLVVIADLVYVIVLAANSDSAINAIKYRCGAMMDTTLVYFSARFIISNSQQFIFLIKGATVFLIPLAFLGAFEAGIDKSPYDGLLKHRFYAERSLGAKKYEINEKGHGGEIRLGFFRAQGAQSHPINFGLSFVVFLPLIWEVLYNSKWRSFRVSVCAILIIGAVSSLSSGPFIGLVIVLGGFIFKKLQLNKYANLLLILMVVICIFLEFYTDRPHFYHVFASHLAFDEDTAYARTRLFEAAIEHLPEYWLTGYGNHDPGWGPEISGTSYTDVCVHYVALAVHYGIFGLLAYIAIVYTAFVRLWTCQKRPSNYLFYRIMWGLLLSLAVMLGGHLSISPFGSLQPLYNILFGLIGSMTSLGFAGNISHKRQVNNARQSVRLSSPDSRTLPVRNI